MTKQEEKKTGIGPIIIEEIRGTIKEIPFEVRYETKQEEIREGMIEMLRKILVSAQAYKPQEQAERIVDEKFLPFLHYNDVVIKAEKQLADIGVEYYHEYVAKMLKAGCGFFKPLIKEEEDGKN